MKHIFIVNPAAGKGIATTKYQPQILNYLKDSGLDYEVHRSLNKEEIGTYIKQKAADGAPVRFYGIGGDGTLCDVANGAIGLPNVEVAIIPCGTGNDFVRNFSNKENFLDIEKQINGKAVPVDAIRCNDFYSMNMLNIGADCEVVVKAANKKHASGSLAYAIGALEVLPHNPRYRMVYTDETGEEHEEDLLLCCIGNGHYCGGGFKGCPRASLQDGLMDVVIVRPVTGMLMMKMLLKYHNGTHLDAPEAADLSKFMQVKNFKLRAIDQVNVSVDGEVKPFTEGNMEVVPGAINFVVPEGSEIL